MAGSGAFRRLPATSTRLAGSPARRGVNRSISARGPVARRPGGKPRGVAPEIAQDRGEPTPEPVLPDVPAGELPQLGLDLHPHAFPQNIVPAGKGKENNPPSGSQIQGRPPARQV